MIEFLLIGILLASLFIYSKINKNNQDIAINKGIPTIGTVTESAPPAFFGGAHTNFTFYTKSNQRVFISGFKRPNDKINEGDKFLVLYLREKPKTAVMLFDYPIRDSVEFKKYVNEFEQKRKHNK